MFHKIFFGDRHWPNIVFLQSSREVNTVLISQFKLGGWAQVLFNTFLNLLEPWVEYGWDKYVIPLSPDRIMKIKWAKIWKFLVYKQLVSDQASIKIQNYLTLETFFLLFILKWVEHLRKVARLMQRTSVYSSPRLPIVPFLLREPMVFISMPGVYIICKMGTILVSTSQGHCEDWMGSHVWKIRHKWMAIAKLNTTSDQLGSSVCWDKVRKCSCPPGGREVGAEKACRANDAETSI